MSLTPHHAARRQKYIGASEVASILGLNPHQSAYDLWLMKTGQAAPFAGNDATDFGNRFEPVILDWAAEQLGARIRRNVWRVHKPSGILSATLDAQITDRPEAIEAKSSGLKSGWAIEGFGEPGTNEVPDHIRLQAQQQMLCADLNTIWIPALLARSGRLDFHLYRVDRDDNLCNTIVEAGTHFWTEHVLTGQPPEDSRPSLEVLKRVTREPDTIASLPDELLEHYQACKAAEKEATAAAKEAQAALLAALGTAEVGECSTGRITYLEQSRTSIDTKKLKTELPDVFNQYANTSTYRVLREKKLPKAEVKAA